MATQSLVEQVVAFLSTTDNYDQDAIFNNSLIKSLAQNSQGGDILYSYKSYAHWTGTAWTYDTFLELRCYVLPGFVSTIQTNIGNLQAAFPQYQIVTWGYPVTFGN